MLGRLTRAVARRRGWVIAGCVLVTIAAALLERGLFARLAPTDIADSTSESAIAAELARARFGERDPDVLAVYRLPGRGADDARTMSALAGVVAEAADDPSVARAVGPSTPFAGRRFVSADGRVALVMLSLRGDTREKSDALARLGPALMLPLPDGGVVTPLLGGLVPAAQSLTSVARASLARGERIALPIVAVLLVILFGSLVAALLPVATGAIGITLTLGLVALLARLIPVDAFALNVVSVLGLGVAIDYALFIVARYREGRAASPPGGRTDEALVRAVETAGRAVLFSSVTVAASLSGLFVFPQRVLHSIAIGGIAVTLLAAALALVVLPAALSFLGPYVDRGRFASALDAPARAARSFAFWRRLARAVMRRRVLVAGAVTVGLLLLALPFRRARTARADVRALPASAEPRRATELLERELPSLVTTSHLILVEGGAPTPAELDGVAARARDIEGVVSADLEEATQGAAIVRVRTTAPSESAAAAREVEALRALSAPGGARLLVYGPAAVQLDFTSSLKSRAPFMLAIIGVVMFAVLYAAFRSVILPLKAMLMSALSLTASFGAIVFVFQDGRLSRLLAYEALGTIDATLPVVMFAIVFGLSMDYEVLILGRIREEYLRTGQNAAAIADGLAHTGRLVTGAALLMVVVFAAFGAAPVLYVKALGLGMALAVALDATIVRTLLVPSTMALLGRLNWWSPGRRRPARTGLD
jgi:RND superfamily putative drug exporter